jgi:hypothetical protein
MRDTLEAWMRQEIRNLLLNSNFAGWNRPDLPDPHPLWKISDSRIPKWFQKHMEHFPIRYITVYSGEEANYIVLLTSRMEKFYEVYAVSMETITS